MKKFEIGSFLIGLATTGLVVFIASRAWARGQQ